MSTTDVEDILGAHVPLPYISMEEAERTGSQSVDEELRQRFIGGAETSTLVKIFPFFCNKVVYALRVFSKLSGVGFTTKQY